MGEQQLLPHSLLWPNPRGEACSTIGYIVQHTTAPYWQRLHFLARFFVRLKENAYLCTRFKVESSVGLF